MFDLSINASRHVSDSYSSRRLASVIIVTPQRPESSGQQAARHSLACLATLHVWAHPSAVYSLFHSTDTCRGALTPRRVRTVGIQIIQVCARAAGQNLRLHIAGTSCSALDTTTSSESGMDIGELWSTCRLSFRPMTSSLPISDL